MTTFEHAMLGITTTLATGCHRRYGWQLAAVAGVAAIAPDWDGLPIVVSVNLFNEAHRVWGHNVFACIAVGTLIGVLDYRADLVTRFARWFCGFFPDAASPQALAPRTEFHRAHQCVWVVVAVIAALSQIPADMVVSGTATLNDWEIQPFWPISRQGWVYAMVPWGDIGVTVVFVIGMFAMLRWKSAVQPIACVTIGTVGAYIVFRGALFS